MLVKQSGLFEILKKWAEIRTQRILNANREQCSTPQDRQADVSSYTAGMFTSRFQEI
jgi:hypothetical protein